MIDGRRCARPLTQRCDREAYFGGTTGVLLAFRCRGKGQPVPAGRPRDRNHGEPKAHQLIGAGALDREGAVSPRLNAPFAGGGANLSRRIGWRRASSQLATTHGTTSACLGLVV